MNDDLIARFGIDKGKLTQERVRPKAFEPNGDFEVSIFSITGLSHEGVLCIGKQVGKEIAQERGQSVRLFGWARFQMSLVVSVGLLVERDDSCDYGDHANIIGWPKDDPEAILRLQVDLAAKSFPVRLPKAVRCEP